MVGNNHFSCLNFVLQPFLKDIHVVRFCKEWSVDPDTPPHLHGYTKLGTRAGVLNLFKLYDLFIGLVGWLGSQI